MNQLGHIAAGDARTAAAGAALLRAGGNAVDAAVGATFAAFTAEPVLTAPCGGGFGMVAAPGLAPVAYDFFADIPGEGLPPASRVAELDFRGLEVSFGPTTQVFHAGRGATAVPLLLPGLVQLQRDHGKLPLARVLEPAVALAEQGAELSDQVRGIARILTPILTLTPATAALFAPRGQVLGPGEAFRSPQLAAFLRQVAAGRHDGAREALEQHFGPPTGRLTAADLAKSTVYTHAPIEVQVSDYTVALNPPPSLGGLLVALGLRLLARVPARVWQNETDTMVHLLACMAVTQAVRSQQVDPAALQGSTHLQPLVSSLLDDRTIDSWNDAVNQVVEHGAPPEGFTPRNLGSTTHVSCIDSDGVACAITSSNGEGCGYLVPGVGVMANNFLGEEDINPGGFHRRPPGERMTSMMCPTIVLRDGKPLMALGTGGSNRIRTALLQVLVHHLLRGADLATAVKMPRIHYEGGPLFVERKVLDMSLGAETLTALEKRVRNVVYFDTPNMFFGGVHAAARQTPGIGDARRSGHVAFA